MEVNLTAFISFVFVTTFTPGPNNIASASLGMLVGYRQTLRFLLGIMTGFFLMLWLCAMLSSLLLATIPFIESYLKYIGAIYILWLAYQTMRASYASKSEAKHLASFSRGFWLQLVNPKGVFYGMTVFTTFLAGTDGDVLAIAPWTFLLIVICFISISTWTLFGNLIQKHMRNEKLKRAINLILALALVLTALQIAGLFESF